MNLGPIDYTNPAPPNGYRCALCGAHGGKLWRDWNAFVCDVRLSCCVCTAAIHLDDPTAVDERGRLPGLSGSSDQIGGRAPAVPTPEGDSFWGYTSVPPEGVAWWRRLPTRAEP